MGDSAYFPDSAAAVPAEAVAVRHPALIRVTHWITTVCFLALLASGIEIVISHPRFYWGEDGNVLSAPLFKLPIPASRSSVPTGYLYVLPDQNGWSRYLHFQAAWLAVLTGVLYIIYIVFSGYLRRNLLPREGDLSWRAVSAAIANHVRFKRPGEESYNLLQRITYLAVIFVLFPLVIWTGLAMSPAFVSVVPATAGVLGGQESARTIHFFVSLFLLIFLVVHVVMICRAGFAKRMRAMITGRAGTDREGI